MKTCLAALIFSAVALGASAPAEPQTNPCILESSTGCEVTLTLTSMKDAEGIYHSSFLLAVERPRSFHGWIEFDAFQRSGSKWLRVGAGAVPPGDPPKGDNLLVTVGQGRTRTLRIVVRVAGTGNVFPLETAVVAYMM